MLVKIIKLFTSMYRGMVHMSLCQTQSSFTLENTIDPNVNYVHLFYATSSHIKVMVVFSTSLNQ